MKSPESDDRLATTRQNKFSIEDLPDEVFEFVLSFVSPYKDLHNCMLVSKKWKTSVTNVVKVKRRNLLKALSDFDVKWCSLHSGDVTPTIGKRYGHSAVIHDNSMYIFGGCTSSMTTFNDLWSFDLSKRQWNRTLAQGIYPTPKACSTLVCYKDTLVLFGGWAYPCNYPFHQNYQLFNELHTFNITENRWSSITTSVKPPPTAGHSVSVHGHYMLMFGGMQRDSTSNVSHHTNDIWRLDLDCLIWEKMRTGLTIPSHRYGHTQTQLDNDHFLIMGGCDGPNGMCNDVWILDMSGGVNNRFQWKQVEVRDKRWAPPDTWCHPTCRVGDHIVILNRLKITEKDNWPSSSNTLNRPNNRRSLDKDEHNNSRRAPLKQPKQEVTPAPSTSTKHTGNILIHDTPRTGLSLSAFTTTPGHRGSRLNSQKNRERQLEFLRKMENQIKNRGKSQTVEKKVIKKNVLGVYLLDITHVLDPQPYVCWVQPKDVEERHAAEGPDETVLYSLVQGKAELIMFGGVLKESGTSNMSRINVRTPSQVSNSLHFISAPIDII